VVHSIELLFDADTEAEIRRQWDALAAAGLPSAAQNPSPTNRPHVTLAVAERIDPDADADLRSLAGLPLECRVGAPMLFGGVPTLVRLIVPTAALLTLHRAVVAACLPHAARAHAEQPARSVDAARHAVRRLAPTDVGWRWR
jgi:hypothetical protein